MKKHKCKCGWIGIKRQMYPWVNVYRDEKVQLDCPKCNRVLFRTKKVKSKLL